MNTNFSYSIDQSKMNARGGWSQELVDEINRSKVDVLNLLPGDWSDLSFIKKIPLKGLVVNSGNVDWGVIQSLDTLELLEVKYPLKKPVNLSGLNNLSYLKYAGEVDLIAPKNIEILILENFKGDTVKDLECAKNVVYIELISCKNIISLHGLEGNVSLKGILLYGMSKLVDISSLSNLNSLEYLFIDGCKNIDSFECLSGLSNLEELVISNCGDIASLGFIKKLPRLKYFAFGNGTKICDGDLTPILNLKKLEFCKFNSSKDYNLTNKDVNAYLLELNGKLFSSHEVDWKKPCRQI